MMPDLYMMQPDVVDHLLELNRRFYAEFGPAFAVTRRRIQDGVRRVLDALPDEGRWLDLGCGSGALAVEWLRRGRASAYIGVDFSAELLREAVESVNSALNQAADKDASPISVGRTSLSASSSPSAFSTPGDTSVKMGRISFKRGDLSGENWAEGLAGPFRGALAFAVLHHLPSRELRLRVLRQVNDLLQPGGWFVHSEWQFQHSPRLMGRCLPWSAVGLTDQQVEPGDTLLDWRFALPGQAEQTGLRYAHLFTRAELAGLAADSGFAVQEEFESDGQGGRLGLYQFWQKQP